MTSTDLKQKQPLTILLTRVQTTPNTPPQDDEKIFLRVILDNK